ncbi:hypothetical protein [Streptomyces hundungensis]|uniref:hypothetical protein n=1 Tax=Streptomyces hundungensis TaxID=1077946 RepID=UPI0031EEC899
MTQGPEEVATRVLRDALKRIKDHEAEWLSMLCEAVPSYSPEDNLADDGWDTDCMDEIQTSQAFDAQLLLRTLLAEFEQVAG